METERYYYAVASFMRKDDKISVVSVACSVRGAKKDIKVLSSHENPNGRGREVQG